jgi:hypothetical protein
MLLKGYTMVTRFSALVLLLSVSTLSHSFSLIARRDCQNPPSPVFKSIRRHVFQVTTTGEVPLVADKNLTMMLLPPWYHFRRPKEIIPPVPAPSPLTIIVPEVSPHSPITVISTQSN